MKKIALFFLLFIGLLPAQILKESILDTNQVIASFDNRGSMRLQWPKGNQSLLYVGVQGFLVGGEVINSLGDTLFIVSDGFTDSSIGDYEPGTTNPWGWLAIPGYSNPSGNKVAISNDLASWTPTWQIWPGKYGNGVLMGDLESYWIMDDSANAEFNYYPVMTDSSIRGLGLEVSCRGYQWDSPIFEDFVIFTYDITNVGDYPLTKLVAGFFSDPTIGGPTDFMDDLCSYNFAEDLVICWDADGIGGGGIQTGYFGIVTLDSPDLLGLTAAASVLFGGNNRPKNDDLMWFLMKPGMDSTCAQPSDFVLTFASGYFSLAVGETKSYAIACVFGSDEPELLSNVGYARLAYDFITVIDEDVQGNLVDKFRLETNYPNPFNSGTVIEYELINTSQVTLKVYDLLGSEIQILIDEPQNPGTKRVFWDGRDKDGNPVSSGVYVYRIEANNYSQSKKMILIR